MTVDTIEEIILSWGGDRVLVRGPTLALAPGREVTAPEAVALAKAAGVAGMWTHHAHEVTAEGYTFQRMAP